MSSPARCKCALPGSYHRVMLPNEMNAQSNITPQAAGVGTPGYRSAAPQPFHWSVWRGIWENTSIFVAAILCSAVWLLLFFLINSGVPEGGRGGFPLHTAQRR